MNYAYFTPIFLGESRLNTIATLCDHSHTDDILLLEQEEWYFSNVIFCACHDGRDGRL